MIKLPSKIFIDGGDPEETKKAKELLGRIDGQTTNPTLISKNPQAQERLAKGEKFDKKEVFDFYKKVVSEIAEVVDWSVSIEPYADKNTSWQEVLEQGRKMFKWIDKAWIKFPITDTGLKAAYHAVKEGIRANMTLCFSQEQAAAVYAATRLRQGYGGQGQVFVSPFVGRLDDRGENGMQLIENILEMYKLGDGHVLTLTASVRTLAHFLYALKLKSPIITVPYKIFQQWVDTKFQVPDGGFTYAPSDLSDIPYQTLSLKKVWTSYNIAHDLTDIGIEKFSADWNSLVRNV
jgi:transaldolase